MSGNSCYLILDCCSEKVEKKAKSLMLEDVGYVLTSVGQPDK